MVIWPQLPYQESRRGVVESEHAFSLTPKAWRCSPTSAAIAGIMGAADRGDGNSSDATGDRDRPAGDRRRRTSWRVPKMGKTDRFISRMGSGSWSRPAVAELIEPPEQHQLRRSVFQALKMVIAAGPAATGSGWRGWRATADRLDRRATSRSSAVRDQFLSTLLPTLMQGFRR